MSATFVNMYEYKDGTFRKARWFEQMFQTASNKTKEYWLMLANQVSDLSGTVKHHAAYIWKKMTVSERVRFTLSVKENLDRGMGIEDAVKRAYTTRSVAVTCRVVVVILAAIGALKLFK